MPTPSTDLQIHSFQSPINMSSAWGNAPGNGWESKADGNWNSGPAAAAASEQPNTGFDTSAEATGAETATGENNAGAEAENVAPQTTAANEEWKGQGQAKYDYENFAERMGEDYDGNKRVYAWDGEEGDIGPEFPDLEVELFGPVEERGLDDPLGVAGANLSM